MTIYNITVVIGGLAIGVLGFLILIDVVIIFARLGIINH